MSTKDFNSSMTDWVADARVWFTTTTVDLLDAQMPAIRAINNVNTILSSAPADVGGRIYTTLSETRARTFGDHWIIMKEFADSIHYEVSEYIDVPFTQAVNLPMNDAYALNPKDFKIQKSGFLGIPYSDNLWDIMSGMIDNKPLKKDLQEQFKNLNKDKIQDTLKNIVEDANYWAKEFDKAAQIRTLQEDFLNKYEAKWPKMTSAEREAALNEYAIAVGHIMDDPRAGKAPKNIVSGLKIEPSATSYGYTYSTSKTDDNVYIGISYMDSDILSFGLKSALNTVIHESRHQYQGNATSVDPKRHNTPSSLVSDWKYGFDNYETLKQNGNYWVNPVEEDARAFAALAGV